MMTAVAAYNVRSARCLNAMWNNTRPSYIMLVSLLRNTTQNIYSPMRTSENNALSANFTFDYMFTRRILLRLSQPKKIDKRCSYTQPLRCICYSKTEAGTRGRTFFFHFGVRFVRFSCSYRKSFDTSFCSNLLTEIENG